MSKMSQLHAELEEQAYEYGYESLDAALQDGCAITAHGGLVPSEETLRHIAAEEHQKAHEAWLEEKKVLVGDLRNLLIGMHASGRSDSTDYAIIEHALEFIAKGEM